MQYVCEKASFSLKSNDISLSDTFADYPITNTTGSNNATRTITTWNAVNFENILGELYNKSELFNMRLKMICYNLTAVYGVNANDRFVTFKMSGLNWVGSNYDVTRGCNTNLVSIGAVGLQQNTANIVVFEENYTITFQKQQTADLTISMLNANFTVPAMNAGTQMPRIAYYFDLTPVVMSPIPCISLAGSKCSTISSYFLTTTTSNNNIDMYAVLGRENFKIGDKYNLVFKFAQTASWAGTDATLKSGVFNVYSSGMRFQNYETAIGKVGGNSMQLVPYGTFRGTSGAINTPNVVRCNTTNIMTFTLESQICNMTIRFQNLVNNTEYTIAMANVFLCFDIWKCIC